MYDPFLTFLRIMTTRTKLSLTGLLLLVIAALGVADYSLSRDHYSADLVGQDSSSEASSSAISSESLAFFPSSSVPPTSSASSPSTGVARQNEPDIAVTLKNAGFETQPNSEMTFLSQVVNGKATVNSVAMLQNGDRIGAVSWIDSGDVKSIFVSLKEALLTAFSPQMTELRDETLQEQGKPIRNILTFLDPKLSADRLIFVRIRQRLYEFHVTKGQESVVQGAVELLTNR